jgi:hypothetical protein
MKSSRFAQTFLLGLPILCILASFSIVVHQTMRRDRLQKELTIADREYAQLEKRYKQLRYPSGTAAPSDTHQEEHDGHDHEEHDHHEGDRD